MKIIQSVAYIVLVLVLTSCQTSGEKIKSSLRMQTLPNGVELITSEDPTLPYFKLMLWTPYGYAYEYQEKQGLTSVLAQSIGRATESKSKEAVQALLSQAGASISANVLEDQTLFSAESLSKDSLKLSNIFFEALLKPKFLPKDIRDIKNKNLSALKSMEDDPSSLASYAYLKSLFKDHGYSRRALGDPKTLSSITVSDVQSRYEHIMNPKNIKVVMIGQWSPQVETEILTKLVDLEPSIGFSEDPIREIVPTGEALNRLVSKRGLKQAIVYLGLTSIPRSSAEYVALKTGLFVIGGSFKSRLNQKLRIEEGLTYGVSGGLDSHLDGGLISFSGSVRHDKIQAFVEGAKKILTDAATKGIRSGELERAKSMISGQYPKALETREKEALLYLDLTSKGLKGKELYSYLDEVKKLTLTQVNDVLRKRLYMPRVSLVVLGDQNKISEKTLRALSLSNWSL